MVCGAVSDAVSGKLHWNLNKMLSGRADLWSCSTGSCLMNGGRILRLNSNLSGGCMEWMGA